MRSGPLDVDARGAAGERRLDRTPAPDDPRLGRVEPMRARDAEAVLRIYGEGIATGIATFDTTVPTWEDWDAGHRPTAAGSSPGSKGQVVGWTALAAYSSRAVYAGVA